MRAIILLVIGLFSQNALSEESSIERMQRILDIITHETDKLRSKASPAKPSSEIILKGTGFPHSGGRAYWVGDHKILLGISGKYVLWDRNKEKLIKAFNNDGPNQVSKAAVSNSGKYIATSSKDGAIKIWNSNVDKLLNEITTPSDITKPTVWDLVFSDDDSKLVVLYGGQKKWSSPELYYYVAQYSINNENAVKLIKLSGRPQPGSPFITNSTGNIAVGMSEYYAKKERNLNIHYFDENKTQRIKFVRDKIIQGYRFDKAGEGRLLVSGTKYTFRPDTNVIIQQDSATWSVDYDKSSLIETRTFPLDKFTKFAGLSVDVKRGLLIIATDNRVIDIYNYSTGKTIKKIRVPSKGLYGIDYNENTMELLIAAGDRILIYRIDELILGT